MSRADFYVGLGPTAKYLGSITSNAEPENIPFSVKRARTPEAFEAAVRKLIRKTDGALVWPWPYATSHDTDYTYLMSDGQLHIVRFGLGFRVMNGHRGRPRKVVETYFLPRQNVDPNGVMFMKDATQGITVEVEDPFDSSFADENEEIMQNVE